MSKQVTSTDATIFRSAPDKELLVTLVHVSPGAEGALICVKHTGKHNNDLSDVHVKLTFPKPIQLADVWDQHGHRFALNGQVTEIIWHIGMLARYFTTELRLPLAAAEASNGIQVCIYSASISAVYL